MKISENFKILIFSMLSFESEIRPSLVDISMFIQKMIQDHQEKINKSDITDKINERIDVLKLEKKEKES